MGNTTNIGRRVKSLNADTKNQLGTIVSETKAKFKVKLDSGASVQLNRPDTADAQCAYVRGRRPSEATVKARVEATKIANKAAKKARK